MDTCVLTCGWEIEICRKEWNANFHFGSQLVQNWFEGYLQGLNANVGQVLRLIGAQLVEIDYFCCFEFEIFQLYAQFIISDIVVEC